MELLREYGVACHVYIPIVKRAVVDFAVGADWTPAAGDVKISKDGGAAANVTNLPTAIAMGNAAMWDFSLTATEMQAAQINVTVADSATKAVEDQSFMLSTYGNASARHKANLNDSVRLGLTALPNVAAGGDLGLPLGPPPAFLGVFLRKYNTLLVTGSTAIRIQLPKVGGGQANVTGDWTPAAADVKVSKDGGAEANATNTAAFLTGAWELVLTAAELSCKQLTVRIADSATRAIGDAFLVIETFGNASAMYVDDLAAASSGADPWSTALPGAYSAGQAGKIVGDNLNAAVGTRMATFTLPTNFSALSITAGGLVDITQAAADKVWSTAARTLTSFGALVQSIWDAATSALTTAGSIGKRLSDNVDATVSSTATPAQVKTQVVAALSTDTYAEPGQGAPAATTSLAAKLGYLYKGWRNKKTQTSTQHSLFADDAVTVDQKATVSDDSTTATVGEIASGP